MKKGVVKKELLLIYLVIIILIGIVLVYGGAFSTLPTSFNINQSTSNLYNITVNNTATDVNITQVNITFSSVFIKLGTYSTYEAGTTDGTDSLATFTNTSTTLSWSNSTWLILNQTWKHFWFNASVARPGNYNLTITTVDTASVSNSTNISLNFNDTTVPSITVVYPVSKNLKYYVNQAIWVFAYVNISFTNVNVSTFQISNETTNLSLSCTNCSANSWTYYGDLVYSSLGPHNITFYVNDTSGNSNFTLVSIYIIALPGNSIIANYSNFNLTNTSITQIIIPPNSTLTNITLSNFTANQTVNLDFSQFLINNTITTENNYNFIRSFNDTLNCTVFISSNTNIAGTNWNGTFVFPYELNTSLFSLINSSNVSIGTIISLGFNDSLNLSQPSEIILTGQSGQNASWSVGDSTNLTTITTYCDNNESIPTNINSTNRECYTNDSTNTNLIIWTYHFSNFGTYFNIPIVNTAVVASTSYSGGGGIVTIPFWINTVTVNDSQFIIGFSEEYSTRERAEITVGTEQHYVGVISLTSTTTTINVSSTSQQAVLSIGKSKEFEVNNDSYYDVLVTLNSINNNLANLTILSIHDPIIQNNSETQNNSIGTEINNVSPNNNGLLIPIIVIIVIIGLLALFIFKKKRQEK